MNNSLEWYVGYTHQGREKRAVMEITKLGFEVYLPQRIKWIRHARRKNKEHRPLFPRYLFVRLQPNLDSFLAVHRVDGIHNILSNHDKPLKVDSLLVDRIQHEEAAGAYDETTGKLDGIHPGDKVRIVDVSGFEECLAVFSKADTKRRVEVLISMLGGETKISLDISKIRMM